MVKISWDRQENQVWGLLFNRQCQLVSGRACREFIAGLQALDMPHDKIPSLTKMSRTLYEATGWQLVPVDGLLASDDFFALLAERQFPVATFIRGLKDLDYVDRPDLFHELFGHAPMLMQPAYADFVHAYGLLAHSTDADRRERLARLYFYTVEVGLIKTPAGTKIYGGGILSSAAETKAALGERALSHRVLSAQLVGEVIEQPIDLTRFQDIYYVVESFESLYGLLDAARLLSGHPPRGSEQDSHEVMRRSWL